MIRKNFFKISVLIAWGVRVGEGLEALLWAGEMPPSFLLLHWPSQLERLAVTGVAGSPQGSQQKTRRPPLATDGC